MATSQYFNNFDSTTEQRLYNSLINETIQIWGVDAMYIPRSTDSAVDLIFGDDPTKKFSSAYAVEVYVKTVDNFEGQELFSKFGLETQNQVRFLITIDAFTRRVPSTYSRPREGDLVWLTNFQALFEIKYVNEQRFFFAFGQSKFYGFELVCERFRYNDEVVNTGIIEVDDAVNSQVISYNFTMVSAGSGTYQLGEPVYQGANVASANATATVVSWNLPTGILQLAHIQGLFLPNVSIHGANSAANFLLYSYDGLNNSNNLLDNNTELGLLADQILDFSETNPFGEPTQVPVPPADTVFVDVFGLDTIFHNANGNAVVFPIGNPAPTPNI
jgi:hypothetical protein